VRGPDRSTLSRYLASAFIGALIAPLTSYYVALEPGRPAQAPVLSVRKGIDAANDDAPPAEPMPTRASLVSLHAHEILVLSETEPTQERFSKLLRDRVTGEAIEMAPRLLVLLRELTSDGASVRIEFISGYRSWKLNEMLRKKGHNVASRSQHSLGTAMDFRLEGLSSKQLAKEVERLKWRGGLAHYPGDTDRFVHADVGPNRRWRGR
jgi:Bacterial protein of unknown function (DUF882)